MKKRPPKQKPDDAEEYKRFLDTAKEVEADEDPKAMERAFKRIVQPRPTPRR